MSEKMPSKLLPLCVTLALTAYGQPASRYGTRPT
jgi:hypothetical protein